MMDLKKLVKDESDRMVAAMEKPFQTRTAPIESVDEANKLVADIRKLAEQLSSSTQKGMRCVRDADRCLRAVDAERLREERDEVASATAGGELEGASSPSSRKRRRGSGIQIPVTPRRPRNQNFQPR